ncbi:transposase [bacterium]|nr:transposase [bacterium]
MLIANIAVAQVPTSMLYHGKITDLDGVALNGDYSITFGIYDAAVDGTELWTETHPVVNINHGLFTVFLGSIDSLDLPFSVPYWLQIEVEGDIMDPRVEITSSPYALYAAVAESLAGGSVIDNFDTMIAYWDSLRGIPADIADGDSPGFQHVRANGGAWLSDSVTFVDGANITLTQTGDTLEIASSGAGDDGNWALGSNADTDLALAAWDMAKKSFRVHNIDYKGMIVHHDRDTVFTGHRWFRKLLIKDGVKVSYAVRGAKDNVEMESINGHFKGDAHSLFWEAPDLEALYKVVVNRVSYYNEDRLHSALDYQTPINYIKHAVAKQKTNEEEKTQKTTQKTNKQLTTKH